MRKCSRSERERERAKRARKRPGARKASEKKELEIAIIQRTKSGM